MLQASRSIAARHQREMESESSSLDAVCWVGLNTKMKEKKTGHEFGGLASIMVDMDRANESLAVLGMDFVPRFAS